MNKSLAEALREFGKEVVLRPKLIELHFDATGNWVYGENCTEVSDECVWEVDPESFSVIYVSVDGSEREAYITEPTYQWPGEKRLYSVKLKCNTLEKNGVIATYKTAEEDGIWPITDLAGKISERILENEENYTPIVTLSSKNIYEPLFLIQGWV